MYIFICIHIYIRMHQYLCRMYTCMHMYIYIYVYPPRAPWVSSGTSFPHPHPKDCWIQSRGVLGSGQSLGVATPKPYWQCLCMMAGPMAWERPFQREAPAGYGPEPPERPCKQEDRMSICGHLRIRAKDPCACMPCWRTNILDVTRSLTSASSQDSYLDLPMQSLFWVDHGSMVRIFGIEPEKELHRKV